MELWGKKKQAYRGVVDGSEVDFAFDLVKIQVRLELRLTGKFLQRFLRG